MFVASKDCSLRAKGSFALKSYRMPGSVVACDHYSLLLFLGYENICCSLLSTVVNLSPSTFMMCLG